MASTATFELRTPLSIATPISVKASGRTDRGVHALEQKCHFELNKKTTPYRLRYYLNRETSPYLYVKDCIQINDEDFHARFSVKSKKYLYKINTGEYNPILNDYLYNGDTILKIVRNYLSDLNSKAETAIDRTHSNFLIMYNEYLANNEFIDYQSSVLANFCSQIIERHPELSFTLRGRIKSLIRLEEKYNRYICTYVEEYYKQNNDFPSDNQIKAYLNRFRDIIAYRYVINIPKCHLKNSDNKEAEELSILYEIANSLPDYLSRNNLEVKPFADLAEVDEQVTAALNGRIDVEAHHRTCRACRKVAVTRKNNCWPEIDLSQSGSHNADDAFLPVLVIEDDA